jgi:hypothetical protein
MERGIRDRARSGRTRWLASAFLKNKAAKRNMIA